MGRRYLVTPIAEVTFECDGCSGGSQKLPNKDLNGVVVSLKFTPSGVSSPAVDRALDDFNFESGQEFVPPVSGYLELAADTLSSEAIRELEQLHRGECSGLEITQVVLVGLRLAPPKGE